MADLKENLLKIKTMTTDIKTTLSEQLGYTVDKLSDINALVQDGTISVGSMRLFETIEDMDNYESAKKGDLAVVYKNEVQNWDGTSAITSFTFPKTVVLSEITNGNCSGNWNDNTVWLNISGNVSSASASFTVTGNGFYAITYESKDGLTYTRTDSYDETITLSNSEITLSMSSWSDVCGNFIQVGGGTFEGLYQYDGTTYNIAPTQLTALSDCVYNKEFYGKNGVETGTLQNTDNLSRDGLVRRADIWNSYSNGLVCPKDCSYLFSSKNYTSIPKLNTIDVTTMSGMFQSCSSLTSLDVSNFDTSNVTNMYSMFSGCTGLASLNLSSFNTSNVTSIASMFYNCYSLTSLNVSSFDTSNVTSMNTMFQNCSSLTSLDLSNFNTSSVTNMGDMFYGCSALTSLDLSNFDTSKVTDMSYMFENCSSLASLGLSNFVTSSVTKMRSMFYGCSSLTSLDLSNFDTSKVTNMFNVFRGCKSLTSLDLSSFDTSNVTEMSSMFYGCSALTSLDLSSFDFTKVTSYTAMFYGVPTKCLIYVKDSTAKSWITSKFSTLTNVQIKEVSN